MNELIAVLIILLSFAAMYGSIIWLEHYLDKKGS